MSEPIAEHMQCVCFAYFEPKACILVDLVSKRPRGLTTQMVNFREASILWSFACTFNTSWTKSAESGPDSGRHVPNSGRVGSSTKLGPISADIAQI